MKLKVPPRWANKWSLLILFLQKFFGLRILCWVRFEYTIQYAKQAPRRDSKTVLAKVRRDVMPDELKSLFDVKGKANETVKLVDVKLIPITNLLKI